MFASVCAPMAARAQAQADGNRQTVKLDDPSRPGVVKVSLLLGSIAVKGYDGKEILVETSPLIAKETSNAGNMKRLPLGGADLSIEEENNQLEISADTIRRPMDLKLTVPYHTSLVLRAVNGRSIEVTGVDGELDVNNVNGSVILNNVSGNVVAHAVNGRVLATLNRVDPEKPMSFSSFNGDVDISLPAGLKANVSFRDGRGDVYTDFDVRIQAGEPQPVEDNGTPRGKYHIKLNRTLRGTIGGGGPEIQFANFNGNIYLRKAGVAQPTSPH